MKEQISDDCLDLNWGLIHTIENVSCGNEVYRKIIMKCENKEWRDFYGIVVYGETYSEC